jgi:hypothetical protein
VFDPPAGSNGDQLRANGRSGQGRSETVGRGNGPTNRGESIVPLGQALDRYRSEATAALDQLDIPPSLRALVRQYFDSLESNP